MPELPVVGDAPSKAASGAGGLIQKRIGPLPLWAWVGGVAVGFLALRFLHLGSGSAAATGVTTAPGPSTFTPASASGSGSFAAPTAPPPPTVVNVIIPGYTQPNGTTGAANNGLPAVVTTPVASTVTSGVGATPLGTGGASTIFLTGPGANAPVSGGPTKYGGPGSGPAITTITGTAPPPDPRAAFFENR